MASARGKFGWYELMTTDAAAAAAFYSAVIGWEPRDASFEGMAYTAFHNGGKAVAGLMTLPESTLAAGAMPGWIGYVTVEDVDLSAERLKAAGGTVHRPASDIPQVGRFAVVADPHGAAFVLFRPDAGAVPAAGPPGTPGEFGWRELLTADQDAAFAFYADLFGWAKSTAVDMGPMGTYQLFSADGADLGGMMTKPAAIPASFWVYYIQVEGIAAAIGRLKAAGGHVVNGPHQVPGGAWIVQAIDPQGAMFALTSPSA